MFNLIDIASAETMFGKLIHNNRCQHHAIELLSLLLKEAIMENKNSESEWVKQASNLLNTQDAPMEIPNEKVENYSAPIIASDATIGEEVSEAELSRHFGEKLDQKDKPEVDLSEKDPFKDMSLEQIKAWERTQDNSNDIYKVKARVQNHVSYTGGSLTGVGEMLCNSYVHVLMSLYEFSGKIKDSTTRQELINIVKKSESMPADLIAAISKNVKAKK